MKLSRYHKQRVFLRGFLFFLFFLACAEARVSICRGFLQNIGLMVPQRNLNIAAMHSELKLLKSEFPNIKNEGFGKRNKEFQKLLATGRFDSPEKLLAATSHFLGNRTFNFADLTTKYADRITIQESFDLKSATPSEKGQIWLSSEVPKDSDSYFNWLSQVLGIYHHAELHEISHELSTNPLSRNGTAPWNYKAKMETAIQEREEAYRAFIARVASVRSDFKDSFPAYVPERGWLGYAFDSARNIAFLRHPWKEISQRPLTTEEIGVRTNHQHYWPRWVALNQMRVSALIGGTVGVVFGGYALTLDEDELEDLAKAHAPDFAKNLFNIDSKKLSEEHDEYYQKHLKIRKEEIHMRLKELEAALERSPASVEDLEEQKYLKSELSDLGG